MLYSKILIYLCLALNIIWANIQIPVSGENTVYNLSQDNSTVLSGKIITGDIQVQSVNTSEGTFNRIVLPGFHTSNRIGFPELPQIHRLIELPQGASPRFEIIFEEVEYYQLSDFDITIENQEKKFDFYHF